MTHHVTIIAHIFTRFQQLPSASMNFDDIKSTLNTITIYLRQLEALRVNLDGQYLLIQQILAKFPPDIVAHIEERKATDNPWTIKTMQSALESYVSIRDRARQIATVQKGKASAQSCAVDLSSAYQNSTDVLVSTTSQHHTEKLRDTGQGFVCVFCAGNHKNADCPTHSTPSLRRKSVQTQNRCVLCLRKGHLLRSCQKRCGYTCQTCGRKGHHHTLLCLPSTDSNTALPALSPRTPPLTQEVASRTITSSETSTVPTPTTTHVSTLLSDRSPLPTERASVMLLTAVTTFETSSGPFLARLLFDTGSQNSYITANLVKRLSLLVKRCEILNISTFGTTEVHQAEAPVVTVCIPVCGGSTIDISAYVIPHIVNAVTRGPIALSDRESLLSYSTSDLAD